MNKNIKSIIQFSFFLGLGIFLVYYAFSGLSANQIETVKQSFYSANYWWIGLGIIISTLSHISRAYRWKMLLQPTGHNPKLYNSFFAVMIGYLANLAFPRLGEVSRCTVLVKNEKIPFSTSFGTVITERIIDTLTWFLLLIITIITQFDTLYGFLNNNVIQPLQTKFSGLLNNIILIVTLALLGVIAISTLIIFRKKILAIPIIKKVLDVLKGFIDGLLSVKKLERPWVFLMHTVFIWLGYILVAYVSLFCMPQTAGSGFSSAIAIIAFATFAVVATQGGIGAYPLLVMQVLFLYGVDKISGLAFGWIIWSAQALQSIIYGFLSMILLSLINKEKLNN
jgi:uncharacterized protein (TIRG00374 family)